jgi:hypothetical protein
MAKKVEVEIDIKGSEKVKGLGQEIRELTKQLRNTPEGTKEWSKIYNKIDDLKDKMKSAKATSQDWIDSLESAGGPLGALGAGLNKLKVSTQSFGAALKATGIGLLVAAIGLLVGAFSETEGSMKKLQPLMIMLEKLFGGLVEAFQPVLDLFLDLAMKVLPVAIDYIKIFYGSLMGLFTLVKEAGVGVGKILKGIFTLDTKSLEEGFDQLKGSWDKAKESFNKFGENFDKGYAKQTKTQKENAAKAKELAEKALAEKLKNMEANDKLDEAQLQKLKEQTLALATTEQQKLDIETAFAKKSYDMKIKDINDKMALYKKDSVEYKNLLAERTKLEGDYIKETTGYADKQKEIDKKKKEEDMSGELKDLKDQLTEKKLTQEQYEDAVYETKKKYAEDKKTLDGIEMERDDQIIARKKKKAEDERAILFQSLQDEIDTIDKKNAKYDNDFALDQERLLAKKTALEEQRAIELEAAEGDAQKQLEIKKKYADAIYNTEQELTNNQKAQIEARIELQNMYGDAVQQFGQLLQQVAGKNKGIAKAGLIIEQAAGVAKVIINTQAAAAKIAATSVLGFLDPRAIITYVMGGISVASAVAATVKGIRQIDAQDATGGSSGSGGTQAAPAPPNANYGKNYGSGGLLEGPRHAAGGMMINAEGGEAVMTRGAVTAFGPLLSQLNQIGGGRSFGGGQNQGASYDNPRVQKITPEPVIVKTYVVSNELTTEQEKQAKLKSLSTL